jgi:hypothetical protein
MKTPIRYALGLICAVTVSAATAQVQTLVVSPTVTNSPVINVSSNSYVTIKSIRADSGGGLLVNMQGVDFTLSPSQSSVNGITFAGPATIQLQGNSYGSAFATLDIEPGFFPPDKTLVVGANSGNVQVTMQMSTDLVNWTPAVNGMIYTNAPDARFFRIQLLTNVQSP